MDPTVSKLICHLRLAGKPNKEPYLLAAQSLIAQAKQLGLISDDQSQGSLPFSSIFCVGDNPAAGKQSEPPHFLLSILLCSVIFCLVLQLCVSHHVCCTLLADIRGANAAGPPFTSVLVKTGVASVNCSIDPAAIVCQDVFDAVSAALHRTRFFKFHSMR